MRSRATLVRPSLLLCAGLLTACPRTGSSDPPGSGEGDGRIDGDTELEPPREAETGDPRLDPSRCTGDALDIEALVRAGVCSIPFDRARPLPSEDRLAIELPSRLKVAPGQKLEFDLVLRNRSREPLDLDLVFRDFLPLQPESTTRTGGDASQLGPDPSCTLKAISTEPPPERITLPPGGELALPCEWFANTRLIDPRSYVGSECPDFPSLGKGDYRSGFRIGGAAGGRVVEVDIKVR